MAGCVRTAGGLGLRTCLCLVAMFLLTRASADGGGTCTKDGDCEKGECKKPTLDSVTGECDCDRFFTGDHCEDTWSEKYWGAGWIAYLVIFIILFISICVITMQEIAKDLYLEQKSKNNVRLYIHVLLGISIFIRFLYLAIDPTGQRKVVSVAFDTVIFGLFFPFIIMAYTLLVFFWAEVVHETLETTSTFLQRLKVPFVIMFVFILSLELTADLLLGVKGIKTVRAVWFIVLVVIIITLVSAMIWFGSQLKERLSKFRRKSRANTSQYQQREDKIRRITRFLRLCAFFAVVAILLSIFAIIVPSTLTTPWSFLLFHYISRIDEVCFAYTILFTLNQSIDINSRSGMLNFVMSIFAKNVCICGSDEEETIELEAPPSSSMADEGSEFTVWDEDNK